MTPEQFVFWLSGFLTSTQMDTPVGLTPEQVVIINDAIKTIKLDSISYAMFRTENV